MENRLRNRVVLGLGVVVAAACLEGPTHVAELSPEGYEVASALVVPDSLETMSYAELTRMEHRLIGQVAAEFEDSEVRQTVRSFLRPGSGVGIVSHPDPDIARLVGQVYAVRMVRRSKNRRAYADEIQGNRVKVEVGPLSNHE